jgi:hypothetical protein
MTLAQAKCCDLLEKHLLTQAGRECSDHIGEEGHVCRCYDSLDALDIDMIANDHPGSLADYAWYDNGWFYRINLVWLGVQAAGEALIASGMTAALAVEVLTRLEAWHIACDVE